MLRGRQPNGETPKKKEKDVGKRMSVIPENVWSWLAEEDIRACSYLATLFATERIRFIIGTDSSPSKKGGAELKSIIALGLGFNEWTNELAKDTQFRLFKVGEGEFKGKFGRTFKTDELIFDGKRIERSELDKSEPVPHDYALIARIVLNPGNGYVHFVCAGRTANGTAAAGHFLATNWKELAGAYKGNYDLMDTHSLAVVIRHKVGKLGETHKDASGEICSKTYSPVIKEV